MVAVEEARAFCDPVRLSHGGGPRVYARPPPCGRALAVLSLSPGAWRRRTDLQSAPRDGEAVRCRAIRVHRWGRGTGAGFGVVCAGGAGGKAAISRAALEYAPPARGSRVPLARDETGHRGRAPRLRL